MHVVKARNVNDAYALGLRHLRMEGVEADSRAGRVLVVPTPVTTVYERPTERVLLDPKRDANPFFHLMEALWMLAGRDDARWLDRFVSDFGSRFAEPDGRIHGAYGRRWRRWFWYPVEDPPPGAAQTRTIDQLDEAVRLLRANPNDRQVVLTMWDPACDLGKEGLRDRPCNTHAYLRVREEERPPPPTALDAESPRRRRVLDLTVLCRSNDVVWGAYGANAVHFSVLQEYLAGRIGVGVGRYYQVSNNFHAYLDALERVGTPDPAWMYPYGMYAPYDAGTATIAALPMGTDWAAWDEDLRTFIGATEVPRGLATYTNGWFTEVAEPMWVSHDKWRRGNHEGALRAAETTAAPDWRAAAIAWMRRRLDRRNDT